MAVARLDPPIERSWHRTSGRRLSRVEFRGFSSAIARQWSAGAKMPTWLSGSSAGRHDRERFVMASTRRIERSEVGDDDDDRAASSYSYARRP
jgi:hypothetical protein